MKCHCRCVPESQGRDALQADFPLRSVTAGQQGCVPCGCSGSPAPDSQRLCPPRIRSPLHLRRGGTEEQGGQRNRGDREGGRDILREGEGESERTVRPVFMGRAGALLLSLRHTPCLLARDSVGGRQRSLRASVLLLLDKMNIPQSWSPWKRVCCHPAPPGAERV